MVRILVAALALSALPAAALAEDAEDTMVAACTEAGNDAGDCRCAAELIGDELTDAEMDFMIAAMDAGENDPNAVMAIAAEHEMTMEDIMMMGQKMQALSPRMRDECGIEDAS
ncbi:hypothetical protein [Hyphobacterium marinum]|uniref:Uncharacterized protein n=1 Tax=Hyphobacterium marinum TaxID=3116574 RepID=A0ABU7LVL7_9PROT|nr:hypothetical protein [Hyphobacterium sp. Y6023]MEE2565307.1 hypothetical protein [Hyphobacterium sp. Y6023]